METLPPTLQKTTRQCLNSKSRANPDVQCPFQATHGDYCSRHFKNPRPYCPNRKETAERVFTRTEHGQARRLQTWWRRRAGLLRYRHQGPAANARDLAMNQTELFTFDPVVAIPSAYFISLADSRKTLWAFDIRTLVHTMGNGEPPHNPYTREELTLSMKDAIHRRIEWLRARRYQVLHVNTDVLTPEQIWNQKVLDIFLKIEALGYYANCEWFHELRQHEQAALYSRLYNLWEWRLGLSAADKERIVPGHLAAGAQRLFRFPPGEQLEKSHAWWQRTNLALIESLVTRAGDAEQRKLGAMYVLMGLVQVSRPAARALPWVVETVYA